MARMIGKKKKKKKNTIRTDRPSSSSSSSSYWEGRGVAFGLRSSVEQTIPRVRPVVAFGFEYSTMP
eukprot:2492167-Prymnesium_polylepis.1